ncbi:MAG TPA: DUF4919 domain-containing protein [Hanamia sp.]|nr:DUF4919 domain-containing protein [Hanamia sp.]
MKLTITILLIISTFSVFGQNNFSRVNRDSVKFLISDQSKDTYYPKLMKRFNDFDTTLTLKDYRLLYYGFVFQKEYSSGFYQDQREITLLINEKKFALAIKTCDSILQKVPVSLIANYLKGFAIYMIRNTDSNYLRYRTRYSKLREAILSSGNGLTCSTSFKTIFVSDDYEIMYRYFQIPDYTTQYLVYNCDKFEIKPSKYFQSNAIYFDASEPLLNTEERLKKK